MNSLTDQQLLRDYTGRRSEAAFAELVRRHVDFVYSAALRMVRDVQLAEDVAQSVFEALAQNARQLTDHAVLSGWLHRTTQNLAANAVRTDVRRRAREQEAAAMNELISAEPDAIWEHIAPQLDEALGELNESDRDALLLRYFERKSAREMAQTLGTSEDAAQRRVSRAVERLREFFAKRGITVGASGLVVVITANSVQAAPVGLAATIATAAALAGTAIATTATATKAIVMTTLQKALIAATVVAAIGTGIYEARRAAHLQNEVQTLWHQQAPLAEQIMQLTKDRENTSRQLAALRDENERLNRNTAELLSLRGEVGILRKESGNVAVLKNENLRLQQEASRNSGTNQLQFKGPYFRRDEWSNRGTDKPLNTVLTMLWAMKVGDEIKLAQLVSRVDDTQTVDSLTRVPKINWNKITAVQIVDSSEDETISGVGPEQQTAFIKAIIERQWQDSILEGQTATDQTQRIWDLVKTNGQWLITGGH